MPGPRIGRKNKLTRDEIIKMINLNSINFTMGYLNTYEFKSLLYEFKSLSHNFKNIHFEDLQLVAMNKLKKVFIIKEIEIHKQPVGFFEYKTFKVIQVFPINLENIISDLTQYYDYYLVPDPRNRIKLTEKTPLVTDKTVKIHNLICKWGRKASRKVGDKICNTLLKYNLDEFKECSKTLYRGFNLSKPALKRLEAGKTARLRNRIFSSWSEDKELASDFANNAIFKYEPENEVIINISLFEEKVFQTDIFYEYTTEKEYILLNSPKMLTLHPKQLVKVTNTIMNQPKMEESELFEDFLNIDLNSNNLSHY